MKLGRAALYWCIFINSVGLFLAGAIYVVAHPWASMALTLYFIHALLVAPLLFLVAIVNAPRGTFRGHRPPVDTPVTSYRRLFWSNMGLVVVVATVLLWEGWGALLAFPLVLIE